MWFSILFFFVFAHEVFGWSVPCSLHNNLCNNHLTIPVVFTAAGELFLVVFIPSSVTGFHSLRILCTPLFLSGQDLFPVLCIISLMVGTPTNIRLLVIVWWRIGAIHLVWRLTIWWVQVKNDQMSQLIFQFKQLERSLKKWMNDEKKQGRSISSMFYVSVQGNAFESKKTSSYKHLHSNCHQLRESGLISVKYKQISHLIGQNVYQPCSKHNTRKYHYSYRAVQRLRSMRVLIYAGRILGD